MQQLLKRRNRGKQGEGKDNEEILQQNECVPSTNHCTPCSLRPLPNAQTLHGSAPVAAAGRYPEPHRSTKLAKSNERSSCRRSMKVRRRQ
jgi:hypothetical protein